MLATTTADAAKVVLAAAGVILALSLFLLVWRRGFQRVDVRVGAMHASVQAIEREVKANGGSSLRDAVDRVATQSAQHGEQLAALKAQAERQCAKTEELTVQTKLHRVRLDAIEDAVTTPARKAQP